MSFLLRSACKCLRKGLVIEKSSSFKNLSTTTMLNKLITLKSNDEFLSKVMNSDKPVIVNFHAEWCEPCHILTPKLEEIVMKTDEIDLATIDVANHAELAQIFEVKAVPSVVAVRNGLVVDKFIGLVDANSIDGLIEKLLRKE